MRRTSMLRNVSILAVCQGFFNSTQSIMISIGGLVGFMLATDKSLATLPVTAVVTGTAIASIPASFVMDRIGRRAGFIIGSFAGIMGAALAGSGVYTGSFLYFVLGSMLVGIFAAFANYYRFAAADVATEDYRSRAISYVMAGGVIAGFMGPQIALWTENLLPPYTFLGSYFAIAGLLALTIILMLFADIPHIPRAERAEENDPTTAAARPLPELAKQPVFIVAVLSGMIGYGVMSLIMTATPLAMVGCGLHTATALGVIQWHVVAMFAPSFFTGHLIHRFGVLTVILTGVLLMLVCVAIALSGQEAWNFYSGLILLGLGWNFMFIGGTTLLTEAYTAKERAKVQAMNEFMIFGTVAAASLSSGKLLDAFGWNAVVLGALPLLTIAGSAALWLAVTRMMQRRNYA